MSTLFAESYSVIARECRLSKAECACPSANGYGS
jgi:hypothetical protein